MNQGFATLALLGCLLLSLNGWAASGSLQFIHNSPDSTLDSIDVTIYAGGTTIFLDNFSYLTSTKFYLLGTGTIIISVASDTAGPNGPTLFNRVFNLAAGDTIVAILNGIHDTFRYPGITTLHIDTIHGRASSSNPAKNDILVHSGAPDAPALNFTTALDTLYTLGTGLNFRDFGPAYVLLDTSDSLIKVWDSTMMGFNRTYMFPSQYWNVFGRAGLIFSSGFVNTDFTVADPDFHLYYVSDSGGAAIPLIEMRNDAPLWIPDKYSLRVWFGEVDTFACDSYTYFWTFYPINGTNPLDTLTGCHPIVPYPSIGSFPFTVTISRQGMIPFTIHDTVEVPCPVAQPHFTFEQDALGYLTIENFSTVDSSWETLYTPVLYKVTIGSDTVGPYPIDSFPRRRVGPLPVKCDPWEVTITTESPCGGTASERFLAMKGYVKDTPLRAQHCICSPGHTPIEWSRPRPDYQFLADMNHNQIDDALEPLNQTATYDVLVYYFVPETRRHQEVKAKLDGFNASPGYRDRFCEYLTVASFRDLSPAKITDLLTLKCDPIPPVDPNPQPFVAFIASDEPVSANSNFNGNFKQNLNTKQIMKLMGLKNLSEVAKEGDGVGIGIIGSGRAYHYAFAQLMKRECPAPLFPPDHYFENYIDFTGPTLSSSCEWGSSIAYDEIGDGAAKTSLLTTQNNGTTSGICSLSEYFFLDVVNDGPKTIRPSDILEAFDWAIKNKNSTKPMSIVICDFAMPTLSDDKEAISAMVNVASSYGLAVIAGTGTNPNGLCAPGAATQSITVASVVYSLVGPDEMASGQGHGQVQGSVMNDPLDLKPEISAICNAKGAGLKLFNFSFPQIPGFNYPIASPEVPAFVTAGLASLILVVNPYLNLEKLKLLLKKSAIQVLGIPDYKQGYGIVDPSNVMDYLNKTPKCDLGFEEYYGLSDPKSHDSKDINVTQNGSDIQIEVTITNFDNNPYFPGDDPGTVSIRLHAFSNKTDHAYDIVFIEKPIPSAMDAYDNDIGNPNDTQVITFSYHPMDAAEVFCVEASINCICDCKIENDIAKRNDYRICVDSTRPTFDNVWQFFGPNDSAEIYSVVTETPPNSGLLYGSSFARRIYAGNEYPIALFDTISIDSTIQVPGAKFSVTFYAIIYGDTLYNGGVTYTICDTIATGTPEFLPPPNENIKIVPVPATEKVTVRVEPGDKGIGSIELYSVLGQLIERREVNLQKGITKEEVFALDDLPAGMYLFRISLHGRASFKKFVKI